MGAFYIWDFSKLPESQHNNAIRYYETNDIDMLVYLHNKYELSKNVYCCSGVSQAMHIWYSKAINNGLIKKR